MQALARRETFLAQLEFIEPFSSDEEQGSSDADPVSADDEDEDSSEIEGWRGEANKELCW